MNRPEQTINRTKEKQARLHQRCPSQRNEKRQHSPPLQPATRARASAHLLGNLLLIIAMPGEGPHHWMLHLKHRPVAADQAWLCHRHHHLGAVSREESLGAGPTNHRIHQTVEFNHFCQRPHKINKVQDLAPCHHHRRHPHRLPALPRAHHTLYPLFREGAITRM